MVRCICWPLGERHAGQKLELLSHDSCASCVRPARVQCCCFCYSGCGVAVSAYMYTCSRGHLITALRLGLLACLFAW